MSTSRSASHPRSSALPPVASPSSQSASSSSPSAPSAARSGPSRSPASTEHVFLRSPSQPHHQHFRRRSQSRNSPRSASWSSSRSATPRSVSPVKSFSPYASQQQQQQQQRDSSPASRQWAEAAAAATSDTATTASSVMMSPLARALQAQWKQLQQDMLSPSALHLSVQRQHTTAEEDVLRVLGSLANWAEMAVEDAEHVVPYLLAFAVAPLPSPTTQAVALAALRGVLSSLPGVFGTAAASAFVQDIFLGEHQALQALSLCALVAVDSMDPSGEHQSGRSPLTKARGGTTTSPFSSSPSSLRPRNGHRSLLSREGSGVDVSHRRNLSSQQQQQRLRQPLARSHTRADGVNGGDDSSGVSGKAADLRSRITHISLSLLHDAATLSSAVADALLSCDTLLKAALGFLTASAGVLTAPTVAAARSRAAAGLQRHAEDVMRLLLTLLTSATAEENEAALVLCSYGAIRAVCTLAQSLAVRSYDARGSVRGGEADGEGAATEAEAAELLLWDALKVLGWLTRGCPAGMKHYLEENESIPSFLYQVLTVPVAEIREAAALWCAALLETQAHLSLQLVNRLLDLSAPAQTSADATATATGGAATSVVISAMGALAEMLRWRGSQMRVYGVSAMLCWRWMLLSHPTRIAAVLHRDSGLLATLIELVLRVAPHLPNLEEGEVPDEAKSASAASGHRSSRQLYTHEGHQAPEQKAVANTSTASLPVRLTALEAVHVLALSYALGSLETRAKLESLLLHGTLSATTLRRLRDTAHAVLAATDPAYYDDFPLMEVKLAEPELSAGMQRAGATAVCPANARTPASVAPSLSSSAAGLAMAAAAARPNAAATSGVVDRDVRVGTSVLVQLTAGAQWRQLIGESLQDLTAGVPAAPQTHTARSSTRSASRHRGGGAASSRQLVPLNASSSVDVRASAELAASAVAPIRVLRSNAPSPSSSRSAAQKIHPSSHRKDTARRAEVGETVEAIGNGGEDEDDEGEHRVDIYSIMAASLAEGQGAHNAAEATLASTSDGDATIIAGVRVPRTVREATLLPTSQSTTTFRFRVVQQAEGLGGLFVQDSMRTVLQLAQHYTSAKAGAAKDVPPGISPKLVRAVQGSRRVSLVRGREKVSFLETSYVDPSAQLRSSSPSAVFGSAPRFHNAPRKEPNPFAPVTKGPHPERSWTVQSLRREDVLLFLIRYTHLMTELPEAIAAVEDHLYYLRRQLQLCPTRDVRRRCVLNDLYMNVYPNMHLFLRFINQQARRSRGVLQMLSSLNGGTVHSGNLLEAYDAVGQCTGLSVVE